MFVQQGGIDMEKCTGCGEKLNAGDKFCRKCGAEAKEKAGAISVTGPIDQQSAQKGADKKTIIIIAAALLVVLAAFLAFGGWNYLFGKVEQPADMTAEGQTQQQPLEQTTQPQENMEQTPDVMPSDSKAPKVFRKSSAKQSDIFLEGRWEGTWNAGFGASGFCSVSIAKNNYVAVCYDNRSTGRVAVDRKGLITFEGPGTTWDCKLSSERGRPVLKGNYSVKRAGTGTESGSLTLYRVSGGKGRS
jgi:hypothetical protein